METQADPGIARRTGVTNQLETILSAAEKYVENMFFLSAAENIC